MWKRSRSVPQSIFTHSILPKQTVDVDDPNQVDELFGFTKKTVNIFNWLGMDVSR